MNGSEPERCKVCYLKLKLCGTVENVTVPQKVTSFNTGGHLFC